MGPLSIEEVLAAEAEAIHGQPPLGVIESLRQRATVQSAETQRSDKDADARSGKDEKPDAVQNRKAFYRSLNKLNRAALCCSGGGIRSATFCLGVIQALAMHSLKGAAHPPRPISDLKPDEVNDYANHSLLSRFHYLSTVSGGGYIGSWLSAWRSRNDFPTVWKNLAGRPDGPDVEPPEISWLRAYSNYLTPRVGIFSADTWTGAAIFLRNLILNWLVIVPAVALVVLVLKLLVTISVAIARIDDMLWLQFSSALVGIALLIVAQAFTTSHRPTRRELPNTSPLVDAGNIDQNEFLFRGLLWALLSAVAVTSFLTSKVGGGLVPDSTFAAIGIGAAFGVVIFAAGWLVGWPLHWKCKDFALWAASGSVYGGLLGFGAHLITLLPTYAVIAHNPVWLILIPVILGVPWVLTAQLFAEMIFVGLVSYEDNSDADREWLGRCAGWVVATAIIWMLTTFVVFAGGHLLIDIWGKVVAPYLASAGGIAGVIGAWIGKSSQTPAKPNTEDKSFKAIASKIGLVIAGPIFAAVLVVGISVALDLLLLGVSLVNGLSKHTLSTWYILGWLTLGLAAAAAVAGLASYCVNINRFSLHALYRNRLVRAYLGASRQQRCPDKLTGFDDEDNPPAHKLWPPKPAADGINTFCLFHVVNITLNVVKATRLAWQERKAESFTVSPLHCGAAYKGFRPTDEYGGRKGCGLSLGTAMAISGAAASPNMGYHSSPSVTLLLALFNVRLGWWLGNPGIEGEQTYSKEGPDFAIKPLAQETFGLTTDTTSYVYLSDGGHFENLGLYEMVRRRCRIIVAVDAGCDPDFAFEDLGNAVRKIFIDLGVRIRFDGLDKLKNRPKPDESKLIICKCPDDGKKLSTAKRSGDSKSPDDGGSDSQTLYHAIGRIHYRDADGSDCEDGWILYIKPAVHFTDNEGAGVRSYATAHPTFPHEPTADQWFTESQFESYRSLGLDIVHNILSGDKKLAAGTLEDILAVLSPTVQP